MIVQDIQAIPLIGRSSDHDWVSRFGEEEHQHTLIEVTTDEGLSGLGSVYTSGSLVSSALELIRPLILGKDALNPRALSESLHQYTFWQGYGGSVTHAISGVDIALWDIMGKATGQSVSRLLGGRFRDKIRPYGSILMHEPTRMREVLQEAMAKGFKSFKLGWGPFGRVSTAMDRDIIAAARDAVGPEIELMVDAGGSDAYWPHNLKWALNTAKMLKDHDILWFEEALRPDDIEGYVELTRQSPVPISCGEVLTRRQNFLPWIEKRAVDYIQPDVTKVGGISEQFLIGQFAHDHAITMIPHGWNTAVGLAADLQLVAAMPVAQYVEYMTPSQYIEPILTTVPEIDDDGFLLIPNKPGLGMTWDPGGIEKLSRGKKLQGAA